MNKEVDAIVRRYVDSALEQLRRKDLMRLPLSHMPPEMADPSIPRQKDWIGWKPIPSTVTDADLDALERHLGRAFPPPYRTFLKYKHFYDLTERGVRFSRHPVDEWQSILMQDYQAWLPAKIVGIGLIPFGDEASMDAGPVCFDTRYRLPDGDCPVVFWDHEWEGTPKEIQPLFFSSRKMFECLTLVAESDIDFTYHDEDDPPDLLPRKKELLSRFLALDPLGAGGLAREYWTEWGVNPDE